MRRDKPDAATDAIVKGLRAAGLSVEYIPGGNGRPDLLVGWRMRWMLLLEIKTGNEKLKPNQVAWHAKWRGLAPVVVRSLDEGFAAVNAVSGTTQFVPYGSTAPATFGLAPAPTCSSDNAADSPASSCPRKQRAKSSSQS